MVSNPLLIFPPVSMNILEMAELTTNYKLPVFRIGSRISMNKSWNGLALNQRPMNDGPIYLELISMSILFEKSLMLIF